MGGGCREPLHAAGRASEPREKKKKVVIHLSPDDSRDTRRPEAETAPGSPGTWNAHPSCQTGDWLAEFPGLCHRVSHQNRVDALQEGVSQE